MGRSTKGRARQHHRRQVKARTVLAASVLCTLSVGVVAQAAPKSGSSSSPHWRLETTTPGAAVAPALVYNAADHLLAAVVGCQIWTPLDGQVWNRQPALG